VEHVIKVAPRAVKSETPFSVRSTSGSLGHMSKVPSFRDRFSPPWTAIELERAIRVVDSRGVELLIIHVSPHEEPGRFLGHGFSQLNWPHARALARAICWLGDTNL
jgi:hypothetical protein